jgi:hypothetical protein
MDIKWFFVIIGIFLTFAILAGMYFVTNFALLQQQKYYQDSQKTAIQRFDNSTLVHDFLFRNITDLKKGLDPIIAIIPNATKSHEEQMTHYNQTTEDFKRIQQVLQIKLQDHVTLIQVNQTVNEIKSILLGGGDDVPAPLIPNSTIDGKCDNDTVPVIENITEEGLLNSLHQC